MGARKQGLRDWVCRSSLGCVPCPRALHSSAPGCEHLPAPACNWVGLLCLCSGPALLVSLPLTVCPEPVARDVP